LGHSSAAGTFSQSLEKASLLFFCDFRESESTLLVSSEKIRRISTCSAFLGRLPCDGEREKEMNPMHNRSGVPQEEEVEKKRMDTHEN
jgi:hypothetical protein